MQYAIFHLNHKKTKKKLIIVQAFHHLLYFLFHLLFLRYIENLQNENSTNYQFTLKLRTNIFLDSLLFAASSCNCGKNLLQ